MGIHRIGLKVKRLHERAKLPEFKTDGAAGADLFAVIETTNPKGICLHSGETLVVSLGISVEIPSGYEMQIRPRSGLAFNHGITIVNAPGTIDSDYRGEIKVALINHRTSAYFVQDGQLQEDDGSFWIKDGMAIAQAVIAKLPDVSYIEVDEGEQLSFTDRGEKGFGSTGI